MNPISAARRRTRRTLWLFAAAYTALAAASLTLVLADVADRYPELARGRARSILDAVVAFRSWNAAHGGVYVRVSERAPPNPYLPEADREVATRDGERLTKVNPAYMTRLAAEELEARSEVRVYLTSQRPLRPENRPDPWAAAALGEAAASGDPVWGVVEQGGAEVFRYQELLRTEEACLRCHGAQGYQQGDVRGGVGVSFSYAPYGAAARRERVRIAAAHGLFLVLGWGLLWVLGRRLAAAVTALEVSLSPVQALEGLLPICCHCKKIRREGGDPRRAEDWEPVEVYVGDRTGAQFSHGICPQCLAAHYPDMGLG